MENLENQQTKNTNTYNTPVHPSVNQAAPSGLQERMDSGLGGPKGFNKKIFILVIVGVLLFGGGALAFFTDLRYKLPFFKPDRSELVNMMYDRLAQIDGADFSLKYEVSIGDRDADAPEPESLEEQMDKMMDDSFTDNTESTDAFDMLSGSSLNSTWFMFEEMLPEDFKAEIEFLGKGFSVSDLNEEKSIPDAEVGLNGQVKLGSLSASVAMEAIIVDDEFYYKVSEFPFLDLTNGHQGEWIKSSPEDGFFASTVPEYDETQKDFIDEFKNFIADTKKYDILTFSQTDEEMEVEGQPVLIFDVSINANNVPTWLEEVRKIALETGDESFISFLKLKTDQLTEEEKQEIINKVNKFSQNTKIRVGLNINTADLMFTQFSSRFIPPAESKKFADKQFNMVATQKIWNQNNPSKVSAPRNFVNQEDIEREDLGLSETEYNDYKQSQRIASIRSALLEYRIKNQKFPDNLSEVTRLNKDRNTGQPYGYSVSEGNYELTYTMNHNSLDISSDSEDNSMSPWGTMTISEFSFPYDYLTSQSYPWYEGEHTADRFSPTADYHRTTSTRSKAAKTDHEVFKAIAQAGIIKYTQNKLDAYYKEKGEYPADIDTLLSEDKLGGSNIFSLYNKAGFVCEDLNTGQVCGYTGQGDDYNIVINFDISVDDIDKSLNSYSYYNQFKAGKNIINKSSQENTIQKPGEENPINEDIVQAPEGLPPEYYSAFDVLLEDTDGDGLSDNLERNLGTDIDNIDSDGDGYSDFEEVKNGYNPTGQGSIDPKFLGAVDLELSNINEDIFIPFNIISSSVTMLCLNKDSNLQSFPGVYCDNTNSSVAGTAICQTSLDVWPALPEGWTYDNCRSNTEDGTYYFGASNDEGSVVYCDNNGCRARSHYNN